MPGIVDLSGVEKKLKPFRVEFEYPERGVVYVPAADEAGAREGAGVMLQTQFKSFEIMKVEAVEDEPVTIN